MTAAISIALAEAWPAIPIFGLILLVVILIAVLYAS